MTPWCAPPKLSRQTFPTYLYVGEAKTGGFPNRGGFLLVSGKVQIVSPTLSGLFLVGAVTRPRKRKRAIRKIPEESPDKSGKSRKKSGKPQKGQKRTKRKDKEKSGKSKKRQKRTKKEGQVQIGKPPPFETTPV